MHETWITLLSVADCFELFMELNEKSIETYGINIYAFIKLFTTIIIIIITI